jgi:hypothetical protein
VSIRQLLKRSPKDASLQFIVVAALAILSLMTSAIRWGDLGLAGWIP